MATLLHSAVTSLFQTHAPRNLQDRRPDPKPVRLVTRMHLSSGPPRTANWRVIAELMDGHRRLVCLGNTAADARRLARQVQRNHELPPHTIGLQLQRWVGTVDSGRWEDFG
jgi:hypothetical protein